MAPCAQGATLTLPEWHALRAALPDICSALDRRSPSHAAGLSAARQVSLCEPRPGVAGIFLPEASPGGPCGGQGGAALEGIQLPAATVKVLKEQAPAITAAAATPLPPLSNTASGAQKAAGRMYKSATGQPLWRIGEAGEGSTLFASVFREMGHLRVGVLTFREQEGAWVATRHGVTLTLDQFHTLVQRHKAVAKAVAGKIKLPFEVRLKDTRKVSVELACGGALVCLDKCGVDVSPGPRKRVRLSGDEWSALVRSFPQMQACIAAQS